MHTSGDFDKESPILTAVMEIISKKRDKELMQMWRDTGIPYFWLRKLYKGDIKNPGVNRVHYLYEHLTGKKLEV